MGAVAANASGIWSYTPTLPVANGTYGLTATETDAYGNVSAVSAPFALTIDTHKPAAPSGVMLISPTNASGATTYTNVATPTLTGAGEAGATIIVTDNGSGSPVVLGTAVVNASGAWIFMPISPLADGPHSISTTATDAAGTVSAPSAAVAFTVAVEAPVVAAPTVDVAGAGAAAIALGIAAPTDPNFTADQLTIAVNTLPTDGTITLADGVTPVTTGETLTVAQLTGLLFAGSAGMSGRSSSFAYTVNDPAGNTTSWQCHAGAQPIGAELCGSCLLHQQRQSRDRRHRGRRQHGDVDGRWDGDRQWHGGQHDRGVLDHPDHAARAWLKHPDVDRDDDSPAPRRPRLRWRFSMPTHRSMASAPRISARPTWPRCSTRVRRSPSSAGPRRSSSPTRR